MRVSVMVRVFQVPMLLLSMQSELVTVELCIEDWVPFCCCPTGFNCGEAVNFAMADWLQFGGAASKRYELLNRPPLLPHEELLCKEAMYLAVDNNKRRRGCADNNNCVPKKLASEQQRAVKVAFVRLMRFQHQVRWLLKKWGSRTIFTSPGFDTSVSCGLCKHMCYVAFVSCRCNTEEDWICLNHGE
jgi:hypothetical protein